MPLRARSALCIFVCTLVAMRAAPAIVSGQTPPADWFTLTNIAANTWAAIDNPRAKQRAYANAGFVIGDDGVVVIDTLRGSRRRQPRVSRGWSDDSRAPAHVRNSIHAENLNFLGPGAAPELRATIESFAAPTVGYDGTLRWMPS
jgi:hypothetical protein